MAQDSRGGKRCSSEGEISACALAQLKRTREKLQVTEIHRRFGDKEAILSFQKRRSDPLENVKELIFVTLLLPQEVSDQEVRLAFWE